MFNLDIIWAIILFLVLAALLYCTWWKIKPHADSGGFPRAVLAGVLAGILLFWALIALWQVFIAALHHLGWGPFLPAAHILAWMGGIFVLWDGLLCTERWRRFGLTTMLVTSAIFLLAEIVLMIIGILHVNLFWPLFVMALAFFLFHEARYNRGWRGGATLIVFVIIEVLLALYLSSNFFGIVNNVEGVFDHLPRPATSQSFGDTNEVWSWPTYLAQLKKAPVNARRAELKVLQEKTGVTRARVSQYASWHKRYAVDLRQIITTGGVSGKEARKILWQQNVQGAYNLPLSSYASVTVYRPDGTEVKITGVHVYVATSVPTYPNRPHSTGVVRGIGMLSNGDILAMPRPY